MTELVHNLDITVPGNVADQFRRLRPLLDNSAINTQFESSDARANRSKLWFTVFGFSSLVLMLLMLLIVVWQPFLVGLEVNVPSWLRWAGAGAGILSLAISFICHFIFRFQEKWLRNRYITERLRQWKFQQLLDGELISLSVSNPKAFEMDVASRWAKAKFDFIEKPGTMNDFVDAENFSLFVKPSVWRDKDLTKQVITAYEVLRLDYEAKYFSFKRHNLETLDVWTGGIAKLTFLIAGVLALSEIVLGLVNGHDNESLFGFFGVAAVSLALLSVAVRIFRSARAISEEAERYTSKWVRLKTLAERFRTETQSAKQMEVMIETERVCVEELREFIRTFKKSDYLM
jgi:hypothetical protein